MPTVVSRPSTTARTHRPSAPGAVGPVSTGDEVTCPADLARVAEQLGIAATLPSATCPADARELSRALVKFAASRFTHRKEPIEDIVQVGTIGLIKAIDRFDPSFEVEFSTFALPTISGEIKRFFRDTGWMVHVPRRLQELRLVLAKTSDAMEQVLDRVPTPGELAAHLDLTEDEVREGLIASQAQSAGSLDAPAPGNGGADGGDALGDRIAQEESAYETVLCLETLKPLIAALPERDRTILSLRFGAELTQLEIGRRLGISQMHVSRLLTRILSGLRAELLAEA
ncbi:SigB/SigF/SigG family RNA polymerase sigma factor [Streptomyces sp. BE303]|uniref:SigB/SigF/SigG family RNA polymerase sigma factor n=1 Tax=Streptomyces sp. BE303 TaxID=3002528 RepID=UPI002E77A236|nr:SigB/SigF/SigG family RNA polymerase sigma factor [Streptomyces sp. BE303]MED7952828.1 SigB/SigF/SigG family RNA polymerase sigma factor [Streptomyces sp. BE303]